MVSGRLGRWDGAPWKITHIVFYAGMTVSSPKVDCFMCKISVFSKCGVIDLPIILFLVNEGIVGSRVIPALFSREVQIAEGSGRLRMLWNVGETGTYLLDVFEKLLVTVWTPGQAPLTHIFTLWATVRTQKPVVVCTKILTFFRDVSDYFVPNFFVRGSHL